MGRYIGPSRLKVNDNDNGLVLNKDKCKFIIVESHRAVRKELSKISRDNKTIEVCNKYKLLGITFDKKYLYD